jgi:hypothetical protein
VDLGLAGFPKSTTNSGGQNFFYKKGCGLPKIFHWEGLDTVFFFASLRVPSRLNTVGGFWASSGFTGLIPYFGEE